MRIRLAQATIAKTMNAPGWVAIYVKDFVATLKEQIQLADAEVRSAERRLQEERALLTPEGMERARQQSREMLSELGPQPPVGQWPRTPLGLEMGVTDKTWRYARQGILNIAKAPTAGELAELKGKLDLAEEKSSRLKTFARFWGIPFPGAGY